MTNRPITEQDEAAVSGPRAMKDTGSPMWCWQTISALQTQWKTLNLDLGLYMSTWADAEEHKVWEKVPYDNPYGSKEQMLKSLEIGDVPAARARVAEQAMDSRPLGKRSGTGMTTAEFLTARIARDRPDIWERMKLGEFSSVAAAAREAGILQPTSKKRVTLTENVDKIADVLKGHYNKEQIRQIRKRLGEEADG